MLNKLLQGDFSSGTRSPRVVSADVLGSGSRLGEQAKEFLAINKLKPQNIFPDGASSRP
jgi:hypothetical protein